MQNDALPFSPCVAVLMRSQNRPVLLARALASVLEQRFQDWRLVLVNDGGDPAPVERLLARHDTGVAGRASVLHLPKAAGPGSALAAGLQQIRTAGGCGLVAFHDEQGSWDPDFLSRMTQMVNPIGPGPVAATSAWTEVRERFRNGELAEEHRMPVAIEPAMVELDTALGAECFPAIAMLCRAEAMDETMLSALPEDGFDRGLARMLLLRGDVALCAEPLAFRHRLEAGAGEATEPAEGVPDGAAARNVRLRALGASDPAWLELLAILAERGARDAAGGMSLLHRVLGNIDRNGAWGHHRHEDLQQRLVRVELMLERIERQLDHVGRATLPVWRRAALKLRRHRDRRAAAN